MISSEKGLQTEAITETEIRQIWLPKVPIKSNKFRRIGVIIVEILYASDRRPLYALAHIILDSGLRYMCLSKTEDDTVVIVPLHVSGGHDRLAKIGCGINGGNVEKKEQSKQIKRVAVCRLFKLTNGHEDLQASKRRTG